MIFFRVVIISDISQRRTFSLKNKSELADLILSLTSCLFATVLSVGVLQLCLARYVALTTNVTAPPAADVGDVGDIDGPIVIHAKLVFSRSMRESFACGLVAVDDIGRLAIDHALMEKNGEEAKQVYRGSGKSDSVVVGGPDIMTREI